MSLLIAAPSTAAAWQFSDQCAPRTSHDTSGTAPNVLMVLDQSGSMTTSSGYDLDGDGEDETRWEAATRTIKDVSTATHRDGPCDDTDKSGCDTIRLGLGFFDDSSSKPVPPGEDTETDIYSALDARSPSGGTQVGEAGKVIRQDDELSKPARPGVGVIISDGVPDDAATTHTAVRQLCAARQRSTAPNLTFAVGFGGDTNVAINSFLAASGGTGTCCTGDTAPCDAADQVDPCDLSDSQLDDIVKDTGEDDSTYLADGYACEGSLEAEDPVAFKNTLMDIGRSASCTFRLDVPTDYPTTGALEDPDATDVTMFHDVYGEIDIPYFDPSESSSGSSLDDYLESRGIDPSEADQFDDDGFYFTSDDRKFVRLTDDLCGAVKSDYVSTVETQVACPCETGGDPCTVDGAQGRCAQGVINCTDGEEVCISLYRPMPEICNNIDDDCDGKTDDLFENEEQWSSSTWDKPEEHAGLSCYNRDVCVCPNGISDAFGSKTINLASGATESEEYSAFLDSWTGACECGVGLGADDQSASEPSGGFTAAPADAPPAAEDGAACSTSTNRPVRTGAMMFIFAIGALLWRRRR
ncbi:MAG: hypothetical protein ACQEVA_12485 [Myxococcota bacterium]